MTDIPQFDLIIVGAPRSGTNMLRDVLCQLDGFATWPCDEINYIWRYGNARWPSDVLPPERASQPVVTYIRRAFARRRQVEGCDVMVEKTCANSLRVPFVDKVFPRARYIFIHRDPVDAVASAILRWNAPFELGYTLAKARFVPLSDLPYYGTRFVWNHLHRLISKEGRVASWGPRLDNMEEILQNHDLVEVCALQWRESVARAAQAFSEMAQDRVHVVRYEDFVATPLARLTDLCEFFKRRSSRDVLIDAVADVSDRSVGKGRQKITGADREVIERITRPACEEVQRLYDRRCSA